MCKTCSTSTSDCISCSENRIEPPLCGCPEGFSDDKVLGICKKCDYKCSTCGKKTSECIKCSHIRTNEPDCNCPANFSDD